MDWQSEIEEIKLNNEDVLAAVSSKLSEKYKEGVALLSQIEEVEQSLKSLKENYARLTEEEMPSMMDEIGFNSITLSSGENISVDSSVHCGIPAARREEAYNWLRDHQHQDLIKNEMIIKFGRNEDNTVGEILAVAESLGLSHERKEKVEPMTLKAFAKEQMKLGNPLPQDLFGVFIKRVVKIK